MKALYELYGQDLGSDDPLPLEPVRGVEQANFQLDAVRRGLDMIRNYGGCYVATWWAWARPTSARNCCASCDRATPTMDPR